jgi:tRNA (uracil-5-)-methyltransferase TRM9
MRPDVARRLLDLNRTFYVTLGVQFDATRGSLPPGMLAAVDALPSSTRTILDAGCGNGRLARALARLERPIAYVGLDADAGLLARAQENVAALGHVHGRIVQADMAQPGWAHALAGERFDAVFCLATLHHMPGAALRAAIVRDLAAALAPQGRLILSAWQFGHSERLRRRVAPWTEIGLTPADVDPGDALLPWDQGGHALRYVHAIDESEMRRLAQAAGLCVISTTYADGREGTLTLYAVCQRGPQPQEPELGERRDDP